jgi:hypothetical protein
MTVGLNGNNGLQAGGGASAASLTLQIRQDRQLLGDWTTCVSAKTPTGQAWIQRLSGDISAAQARIQRLAAAQTATATSAPASAPSRSIDVWV